MSTIAIRLYAESASRKPVNSFKIESIAQGRKILKELAQGNCMADMVCLCTHTRIDINFEFQPIVQNLIDKKTGQMPLEYGTMHVQNL